MSKGRLEAEVKAGVLAYLATRGDFFHWVNVTGAFYSPSGRLVPVGYPGSHDIIGVIAPRGVFCTIELKREFGGVESKDQLTFQKNVLDHGGISFFARSVDEVKAKMPPVEVRVVQAPRRKRAYHK